MTKLWFAAKRYGYGWTPCTWQGWLVIAIGIALIVLVLQSVKSPALIVPLVFLIAAALIAISYGKGEPPRWRWGD